MTWARFASPTLRFLILDSARPLFGVRLARLSRLTFYADLNMSQSLLDIRGRIHRKSEVYFTFGYNRQKWSSWRMFYGATDALLDASMAATAFGTAVATDPAINLLVCYGFLQAIYIQQDAVWKLSAAIGLDWKPSYNPRIREIREIRNRLTGHPALAGENDKPRRLSSAIISYDDVKQSGFQGWVYFEDGAEKIAVDVASILRENETQLAVQMQRIEEKMDEKERQFRSEQAKRPFSTHFRANFDYLLQRLHCDLADEDRLFQAMSHAEMIRKAMTDLQKDLHDRELGSKATSYHLERIFTGLGLLEDIMRKSVHSPATQTEFDFLFDGFDKSMREFIALISELDAQLSIPV